MNRRSVTPVADPEERKVYVGALVPIGHFHLLVEEAQQAGVSRSEVLRRALAARYGAQQATEGRKET